MFNSTKDFNLAMKSILESILNDCEPDAESSNLLKDDYYDALEEIVDRKYLKGITYKYVCKDGHPTFDWSCLRISYAGLSFLENPENFR